MITVRDSQVAVFRQARIDAFVHDMAHYIAAEYPTHYQHLGPAGTREFVLRTLASATQLGIELEGAAGVLIELWLMFGEQLERSPDRVWARKILAHPRLPDFVRVETVQNRLLEKTGGRVLVAVPEPE
jgi:hypothetical protein